MPGTRAGAKPGDAAVAHDGYAVLSDAGRPESDRPTRAPAADAGGRRDDACGGAPGGGLAGGPRGGARDERKSWAVQPTFPAFSLFVRLLTENHRRDEMVELCKQARAAGWLDDRFGVLDICFRSSGATTFEAGLPWASQEDIAYYRAEREREEHTQPMGLK